MKIALAALAAVGALACAPVAAADDSAADLRIGQAGTLVNGDVVQTWTVSGLRTSADVIPGDVIGTLWEATATNAAVEGTVIPIISNFNARAGSANYRVLFGVASPQGINPSTLSAGEKASGKIYFDIPSGVSPDRVVFNDGQVDQLVWVNAPEPVADSPSGRPATPAQPVRPAVPATPAQSPAAASPAAPAGAGAPAATSQGTPAATSQGTPAATSQGTPAGTPAASAGTPAGPTTAAPTTAAPTAPPAATSQGTPAASEGTPAAPATASPAAPAAAGAPAPTSPSAPATPSAPPVPATVIPSATPGASSAGTPAG